ncbi:MAG TPA: hypothetical protein VEJ18_17390 [Planctomycetota bacterium]|nr:hypothetical protein [Planctomycetota bacterium]
MSRIVLVYRPKHPRANERGFVDVRDLGDDFEETPGRVPVVTDRHYEGIRATDGTDIGSRKKRRAWMKRHGYADTSDYSDSWREKRARSAELAETKALRETVARIVYRGKP